MCIISAVSQNEIVVLLQHLNSIEPSIQFTVERETDGKLPFLTHGYSVGVFVSHRYHSISISAFFCVLIASSLLCAPGGNMLDQSRTSLEDFHGNLSDWFIPWIYCLFVQICIVRTVQPSLKRNSFLLRFYRTHVTIIIACI